MLICFSLSPPVNIHLNTSMNSLSPSPQARVLPCEELKDVLVALIFVLWIITLISYTFPLHEDNISSALFPVHLANAQLFLPRVLLWHA